MRWQAVPLRVVARHCGGGAADGGVALVRVLDEELFGVADVAADDLVDVLLRGHREVAADVAEQRAGRTGEVVAVGGHALDHRLAGTQDGRVVAAWRRLPAAERGCGERAPGRWP